MKYLVKFVFFGKVVSRTVEDSYVESFVLGLRNAGISGNIELYALTESQSREIN